MQILIAAYLLTVNAAGLLLMLTDKQKARKKKWRIPEATLLTLAALGGSIGILAGIRLFRHKTLHPEFSIGVPMILAGQILIGIWIYARFCV